MAVVLVLIAGSCGGGEENTATEATPDAPQTTIAGQVSTTTQATTGETTFTTEAYGLADSDDERPVSSAGAKFVLWSVGLGSLSQVIVQNIGSEPGSLAGYWLCQRPSYYEFPDITVPPGELAAVAVAGRDDIFGPPSFAVAIEGVADLGPLDPASGEVGLYFGNDFGNPDAIISYVEWGSSGHGRSETAVSAQIWPGGGFVETSEETGAISATVLPPTDPAHWTDGG